METITWIYTESGHGKGPADGVGSSVKNTITDICSYSVNDVVDCADTVLSKWPASSDIMMKKYTKEDVNENKKLIPEGLKLISKPFGIGKSHEFSLSKSGDSFLTMKKLSGDVSSIEGKLSSHSTVSHSESTPCRVNDSDVDISDSEDDHENGTPDHTDSEVNVSEQADSEYEPVNPVTDKDINTGDFLLVNFDGPGTKSQLYRYVCCVLEVSGKGQYKVRGFASVKNKTTFEPKDTDICTVVMSDIEGKLPYPTPSRLGRKDVFIWKKSVDISEA